MKKVLCLTSFAILFCSQANATTYTWNVNGGGTWEMAANWLPATGYPDAPDDVAIFGSSFTGVGVALIELSAGMPHEDMGVLRFTTAGGPGTYQIDSVIDDNNLEFRTTGGATALLIVEAGSNNVTSLVGPRLFTNLDIDIATGKTFFLQGGGDGTMSPTSGINFIGPGTFTWSGGGNSTSGPSSVQDGLVQIGFPGTGFCPTCQAFSSTVFTISGGTLQHIAPIAPTPGTGNNQFLTTCAMTISGGTWDLGTFTESIDSLTFTSGTFTGAGSSLTLNNAATALTMRDTSLSTTLTLAGGAAQTVVFDATNNGTATIAGPGVSLGASNKIFDVASGTAEIDMTISAPLSSVGGILTKIGAGVLELTGANTYTGGTTVSAGTLLINGSIANGATMVSPGATLGGTGVIGTVAAVVTNSGTVAPGMSPGTLTINGSYTQTAGGALDLEFLSPTSYDKLVVNGFGMALDGTLNLELLPDHSLYGNHELTIIDNTMGTGITGTFATVNQIGFPPLTTTSLTYLADSVLLSLFIPQAAIIPANSVAFSAPVLSTIYKNTLNFMRHLSRIRPRAGSGGGNDSIARQEIPFASQVVSSDSPVLDAIRPNYMASGGSPSAAMAGQSEGLYEHRNDVAAADVSSPTTPIRLQPCTNRSWGVFADAVGSLGRVYSTRTQDPYRYFSAGGLVGFDYVGDRFGIGIAPGYEYLQGKAINDQSKFHIQSAEGTVFGTFLPIEGEDFFIDIIGGGAYQWYRFERNTSVGKVTGKPNGWQGNIYSDIGYTFSRGNGTFTPFLGLGYVHVSVDSYHEQGSIFQRFNIGEEKLNSLRTSLGASANYAVNRTNFSFIPEARFLWQREFLNQNQNVSFASAPLLIASQLQVFGLGRNTFIAGSLLRFLFNHEVELDASYDYEWNSKFHSHLFLAGLEKRF